MNKLFTYNQIGFGRVLSTLAPWHNIIGTGTYPQRPLWIPRDDVRNIRSVEIKFDSNNMLSSITGKNVANNKEVKMLFSHTTSTKTSEVTMYYDGVEEAKATEIIVPADKKIKFMMTYAANSALNVELNVSSPEDTIILGKTEITTDLKIGTTTLQGTAVLGTKQLPTLFETYNDFLINNSQLPSAKVAAFREPMIGIFSSLIEEDFPPVPTIWQPSLCLVGTGLADLIGHGPVSIVYGILNVYAIIIGG
ncbi:MAG: hypothetical protein D6675_16675 [Gemmatimonadetes bacterium]|nr:MAG: hypothetical protein D6675_16675 [Gemmatimonadota bacterium]